MALDAGTVVGKYRVETVLGRGGMATVYSAQHVEHGRRVALKVLADDLAEDPEFVGRFRREGRLQALLDHLTSSRSTRRASRSTACTWR